MLEGIDGEARGAAGDDRCLANAWRFLQPSQRPDRNPVDIERRKPKRHRFSDYDYDYDNDNDNDKDNDKENDKDCVRGSTFFDASITPAVRDQVRADVVLEGGLGISGGT